MDTKPTLVRAFYGARNRGDWDEVARLLAPDVVWHEADGTADYAGDHRGRERVLALLRTFVDVTEGTFVLEPRETIATAEHVAAAVRWRARRGGTVAEGNDLAVFRVEAGVIAHAWFFPDGYDPAALAEVFAFDGR